MAALPPRPCDEQSESRTDRVSPPQGRGERSTQVGPAGVASVVWPGSFRTLSSPSRTRTRCRSFGLLGLTRRRREPPAARASGIGSEVLRDYAGYDDPELNTQAEQKEQAPVPAGLSATIEMTRHRPNPCTNGRQTSVEALLGGPREPASQRKQAGTDRDPDRPPHDVPPVQIPLTSRSAARGSK